MKRLMSIIMVCMLCLSVMSFTASAAKDVNLNITIRDFNKDGVLFDGTIRSQKGLVIDTLGSDKKPVFNLSV